MSKGHRSQIKRERNANKDKRPSAKLSYARVSVQKACFVLDAIRGKAWKRHWESLPITQDMLPHWLRNFLRPQLLMQKTITI